MCASGKCDGGRCVECENNGDCPSGQYCKWKNVPLVLNDCVNKLGNGGWCTSDGQCSSSKYIGVHCVNTRCKKLSTGTIKKSFA